MPAAAYKNAYIPPAPPKLQRDIHLYTPAGDYDLNFCLTSQPIGILKGAGHEVELEPLVVSSSSCLNPAPGAAATVSEGAEG